MSAKAASAAPAAKGVATEPAVPDRKKRGAVVRAAVTIDAKTSALSVDKAALCDVDSIEVKTDTGSVKLSGKFKSVRLLRGGAGRCVVSLLANNDAHTVELIAEKPA